jgi:hypothetical protein
LPYSFRRKEKQETEKAEKLKICTDTQDLKKAYFRFAEALQQMKTPYKSHKDKSLIKTRYIKDEYIPLRIVCRQDTP